MMGRARKKILVASPYTSWHRERLIRIFAPADVVFVDPKDRAGVMAELDGAEVAILKGTPSHDMITKPGLRWVHCNRSGLEDCADDRFIRSHVKITSAAGRSATVLAEHALFFMLNHAYRAPDQMLAQRRRVWRLQDMAPMRGLAGCRVLVIGMGHTAQALVPRLQSLDMEVVAFRRRNERENGLGVSVFCLDAGDRLDLLLPAADFVVLAASLNNSSHRMIGAPQFRAMKPGAFLVNVARAQIVDRAAMIDALRNGPLGGAGVDVTEPEPLPPWDPLWKLPNVMITPHITPEVADRAGREIDIIECNWSRLNSGMPLRNLLTERDAFDHFERSVVSRPQRTAWRVWDRLMRPGPRYWRASQISD
jgi:phosphoglycerate dehydrogenase-like enzyme